MDQQLTPQQELEQVLAAEQALADAGKDPDVELLFRRADLLQALRHYSDSLEACEEALAILNEDSSDEYLHLQILKAHNHYQLKQNDEALAACDRAEQLCIRKGIPLDPRIPGNRALAFNDQGLYDEALEAYTESERIYREQDKPVSPILANNRGTVLQNLGRIEEALADLAYAERLCSEQALPVFPGIAVNRGSCFTRLGRYDEALAAFAESERLFKEQALPVFPGIAANRGGVFQNQCRYEEALAAFAESERLFREQGLPVWPGIYTSRASVFGKLGRYEEALAAYDEAERMWDDQGLAEDWELYFLRAITMQEAGYRDEAIREVFRAIKLCGRAGIQEPPFVAETLQDWMSPKPEKLVEEQIASQPEAIQPVPDSEKKHDVFICYRRDPSLSNSMLLQAHMEMKQKRVFRDQDGLASGRFEDDLREAIRYSRHMVILMTPEFFNRCMDEKDVVRQEIATALHCGTRIIPVMMEGFEWPRPEELPEDIRAITGINAMSHSAEFYTAFIDKLISWME